MAKRIKAGKFLFIECSAGELMDAVGSDICICDWCGNAFLPSDKGCYIAVLNQWYCKKCYEEWIACAEWYPEDVDVERRNIELYARRFNIML